MLFSLMLTPTRSPLIYPLSCSGEVGVSCLTFGAIIEGHDGVLGDGLVDALQELVRQVLALAAPAKKR